MTKYISESDTRANFIDPKLVDSQWEAIHIVREYKQELQKKNYFENHQNN